MKHSSIWWTRRMVLSTRPGWRTFQFRSGARTPRHAARYANPFSIDAVGMLHKQTPADAGAEHPGLASRRPTSLAFVAIDANGNPHYRFYREGVADRDLDTAALVDLDGASVSAGAARGDCGYGGCPRLLLRWLHRIARQSGVAGTRA